MATQERNIEDLRPWIEWRYDRAGGPGGQNVNKVATRATLLFDFEQAEPLTVAQRSRIRRAMANRLSADGRLRVVSQSERSQLGNRLEAEQMLLRLLASALRVRKPRIATRPTAGAKRRRLEAKRQRGETKRRRSSPDGG